jgi:Tfp pilus assembly protein PilF
MLRSSITLFIGLFAILGVGCSLPAVRDAGLDRLAVRKAEQQLSRGIHDYEEGEHKSSAAQLQSALDLGLMFDHDKVTAHKYLAFIHCGAGRLKLCRDEFRATLLLDPSFELAAAEAGHPVWGPIYRNVKGEFPQRR